MQISQTCSKSDRDVRDFRDRRDDSGAQSENALKTIMAAPESAAITILVGR